MSREGRSQPVQPFAAHGFLGNTPANGVLPQRPTVVDRVDQRARYAALPPVTVKGKAVSASFNDAGAGTITLSGTATASQTHSGTGAGTITLTGLFTSSQSHTGSGSGTITLSGTSTRSSSYVDARSGSLVLSGTGLENYVPPTPPGASVVFHDATPEISRAVLLV